MLSALRHGEAYGYAILQRLAQYEALQFTESTVYPALARLRRTGAVEVRTVKSSKGPPRRYYTLSAEGERRLAEMSDTWAALVHDLTSLQENRDDR